MLRHCLPTPVGVILTHCGLTRLATIYITFRKKGMETGSISRTLRDSLTVIAVQMTPERRRK